jgi:hypothetical protein
MCVYVCIYTTYFEEMGNHTLVSQTIKKSRKSDDMMCDVFFSRMSDLWGCDDVIAGCDDTMWRTHSIEIWWMILDDVMMWWQAVAEMLVQRKFCVGLRNLLR